MSDEDSFFEEGSTGETYGSFQREGPLDFFRAYHNRVSASNPVTDSGEQILNSEISSVVKQLKRLVGEYIQTARRVGNCSETLFLWNVLEALRRESLGVPGSLEVLQEGNPTEQFLARSLYQEISEIPGGVCLSESSEKAASLSTDDWDICLDSLANFLRERMRFESYAN